MWYFQFLTESNVLPTVFQVHLSVQAIQTDLNFFIIVIIIVVRKLPVFEFGLMCISANIVCRNFDVFKNNFFSQKSFMSYMVFSNLLDTPILCPHNFKLCLWNCYYYPNYINYPDSIPYSFVCYVSMQISKEFELFVLINLCAVSVIGHWCGIDINNLV